MNNADIPHNLPGAEEEHISETDIPEEAPEETTDITQTSTKIYRYMVGFIIAAALLVFIISTIFFFIRIIPDTFSIVSSAFQSIQTETTDEQASADPTNSPVENTVVIVEEQSDSEEEPVESMPPTQTQNTFVQGIADYSVALVDTGILLNADFIPTGNVRTYDDMAIRFVVANTGNRATQPWRIDIRVDEPRGAEDIDVITEYIPALLPGGSEIVTISFDSIREEGRYIFDIYVDPDQKTPELTLSNNSIRAEIDVD